MNMQLVYIYIYVYVSFVAFVSGFPHVYSSVCARACPSCRISLLVVAYIVAYVCVSVFVFPYASVCAYVLDVVFFSFRLRAPVLDFVYAFIQLAFHSLVSFLSRSRFHFRLRFRRR